MIKIQEESHGTQTNQDMLRMLTFFHDSDSIEESRLIPAYNFTQHNLLEVIEQNLDLRVTPMSQIQQYALINYGIQEQEFKMFSSEILKKKRIMKRQKAKNRKFYLSTVKIQQFLPQIKTCPSVIDLTCNDLEKKRKRNRISAQISRDKKKIYLHQLEQDNKRLAQQSLQLKQENQNLKQELSVKRNAADAKTQYKQPKNIFIKLLVFLGFLFLLSLVKDTFKPRSKKANQYKMISTFQQQNMMKKTQNLFEESNFGLLKGEFSKSAILNNFKRENSNIYVPSSMYEKITEITEQFE